MSSPQKMNQASSIVDASPRVLRKRARENSILVSGPVTGANQVTQDSNFQFSSPCQSSSPNNSVRLSPCTPEIKAPIPVRCRKLVFGEDRGGEGEGPLSNRNNCLTLEGTEEPSKATKIKLKKCSSQRNLPAFDSSQALDDRKDIPVTRQSLRLIQQTKLQEACSKRKRAKLSAKRDSRPSKSSKHAKRRSANKGGRGNREADKRASKSVPKCRHKRRLSQVVLDGMKFKIGDDVYVKRTEDDLDEEEEGCLVCGKPGELIECNNCAGGVHLICVVPPLDEPPEEDWFCHICEATMQQGSGHNALGKWSNQFSHSQRSRTAREMLLTGQLWAARIERLWKEPDGTYWYKGRWYVIPEDTAIGRQAHNMCRELFRTNHWDDNELASIFRHCNVMSPEDFRNTGKKGDDLFLCEYEYDMQFQTFKRIVEIDQDIQVSCDEISDTSDYLDNQDETEDEANTCKGRYKSKFYNEKQSKSSNAARAANVRKGHIAGRGTVGAKEIPESARKQPQTDFERAKFALRLTAAPGLLPYREREIREISAFVTDVLAASDCCMGHCLYISGVPGTGKTATVLEVMRRLRSRAEAGDLCPFRFVEINGLRLTSPEHIYTVLHEALTGHHLGWKKAVQLLDERFSRLKSPSQHIDGRPCILLIDELDLLVTRNQSVLYNLFDWPTRPYSRLFVIGIANTIDLPERLLPRITSRMGLQRISFSPYSYKQLQEIICVRLQCINAFEDKAIEFASRKVAAVSGDARRTLELCRRSVELAEIRCIQHLANASSTCDNGASNGLQFCPKLVGMIDVEDAIKEMFQAPHIKLMQRCSRLAKIFLVAMVQEQNKSGMTETTFEKVAVAFYFLCTSNNEVCCDWDVLLSICCGLGASRLILCEPGSRHRLQKLQLNFPCDDVSFALKKDEELTWFDKYL